jgi:riboflavin synthase
MRKTNLIDLKAGDPVNLERSMRADARNSGHFVQGHVDGTGRIAAFWREGDSLWVRISAPASLLRYIVPKGYVAIDGTSLTVCDVTLPDASSAAGPASGEAGAGAAAPTAAEPEGSFTFMLIAYTQAHIIVPLKAVGDKVNIEVDVLGKLVERSAAAATARLAAAVEGVGARLENALAGLNARLDALEARVRTVEGSR